MRICEFSIEFYFPIASRGKFLRKLLGEIFLIYADMIIQFRGAEITCCFTEREKDVIGACHFELLCTIMAGDDIKIRKQKQRKL